MKRIIVVIAVTFLLSPVFSQNVTIPEAGFLNALINYGVDTDEDGQISYAEAEAVNILSVGGNISNMTGIEAFISLTELYIGSIYVHNLDLSNSTELRVLLLHGCTKISSLNISKNTLLESLTISAGQLTNLDLSVHENLEELVCALNPLVSINISKNTKLLRLECNGNNLTSLDVTNNSKLKILHCHDTDLKTLDLSGNPELIDLWCGACELSNLDLSHNIVIKELRCQKSLLTSLNLSQNTQLEIVYCNGNQITNLDLSNNIQLEELSCGANQLTSLDVSGNGNLTQLACRSNLLTYIDLSNSTLLKTIDCSNNLLTNLDVSKSTLIETIDCSNNLLSNLDVSNSNPLELLHCYHNLLTSLDVSDNVELTNLNCSYNQLSTLNISNDTLLVNCWSDEFTFGGYSCGGIDLSNMPTLQLVYVRELPFPPEGSISWDSGVYYSNFIDTTNSPNIVFDTITTTILGQKYTEPLVNIYPNPTNSLLTIDIDQPLHHSIEIVSLSGQLIYKEEMEGESKQIDLSPFSKGIYFVTIRSKEFVRTEKVVKY